MERRLAAILAADVVGYARLMERDEAGTLVALKSRRREILQPTVSKHHGRIVKVMGDGVLVEFASAVDAVSCAVELQDAMTVANEGLSEDRQIVLRIGVNLGDVIVEGGDLYGDGVNIAARLEALAEPGIILVSHAVFGQVRGKVHFGFDDMGEQSLKNLAEPVRVYRVAGITSPASGEISGKPTPTSKLSIAVVPFTNMSGDPEQEYFSDGITEDIITDLSQVSALFVVARNTVFTFKGKAVEIAQVARKLNVGYVLEGSVRKAGSRIRISAQLIDSATGGHVWAARYDREFGDIFALQDDISKNVVAALKVRLLPEELNAINSRSTANADAYQHYLLGRASFSEAWGNKHLLRSTRQMFAKAAEIDPGYARAYAGIADCDTTLWIVGDIDVSYESILANSTAALGLAPNLAEAHASKGFALYWSGHSDEASVAFERAIELDPELFEGYFYYATACRETGRFDKAAALFKRAAELRLTDYIALALLGDVYKSLGLTDECVAAAKRSMARIEAALAKRPNDSSIIAWGAAVMVYFGENARAEDWAKRAIALSPDDYYVRYNVACTYAVIGKPEAAVECLQFISLNVPRARRWLLGIANHDTQMNSLRDRPDYRAFMKRLEADISEHS